jgi:pilus assembly protein CpaF
MSAVVDRVIGLLSSDADLDPPPRHRLAALVRSVDPLLGPAGVAEAVGQVEARLGGLGPLEPLLADPMVTDVMVNGDGAVWVERAGELGEVAVTIDAAEVRLLVERIVAPLGRRADPLHALVDGRLPDGSRVHVAVPPIAVDGPCITIRRFSVRPVPLASFGPPEVVAILRRAVIERRNVVVSGATGSGKTTLLNALAGEIGAGERVVTIEDAAELRLDARHVVRLEARPPSAEGTGEVTLRDLVRSALRMRPDRIVVGEVRGSECSELIAAMSTGHDGSMSTVHANSASDALLRLEALALVGGSALPLVAVQRLLAGSIHLVVHVGRSGGGARRIEEIVAIDRGGAPAALATGAPIPVRVLHRAEAARPAIDGSARSEGRDRGALGWQR